MKIDGVLIKAASPFTTKNHEESQTQVKEMLQKNYQEEQKFTEEELKEKVDGLNKFLKSSYTNLKFVLHEELNEYYVTIVDEQTKEVIKEIPPKKLLDIYAAMIDALGLFIDKKI